MKIYLLTRNDGIGKRFDVTEGYVIVAETPKEAIELSDIGQIGWVNDEELIDVVEIGTANSNVGKGIILEDYVSG